MGKFQGGKLLDMHAFKCGKGKDRFQLLPAHCWDAMLCRVALAVDSERIGDTYKATELSGKTERQKFLALIFCLFGRKAKNKCIFTS